MDFDLTPEQLYMLVAHVWELGSTYFVRLLAYYNGSYPLAVAAYNAGMGNVNKWLRANGDPRTADTDIVQWIEEIPIYQTKDYVQRVLENLIDNALDHTTSVQDK